MNKPLSAKEIEMGRWSLLAEATGYSISYVYQVITGRRSQTSKGGKKIMKKYYELVNLIKY